MLGEIVEKVLEKAAQHMHVIYLAQIGRLMPLDKSLLELLDLYVRAVDTIQADLVSKQTPRLDLVYDHLDDGRYVRRLFVDYVVGDGAMRRKIERRIAGSLQKLLALVVHHHFALAALHDHLAEFGALVTVSAQFAVQNDLAFEQVSALVLLGERYGVSA